jgi:hypothetical protein
VPATFTEKGWSYETSQNFAPQAGERAIFGVGFPEKAPTEGTDFALTLDLLKGPGDFRKHLEAAFVSPTKGLALALTSSMDPEAAGRRTVYKLYSKDAPKPSQRPVLRLVIE